MLSAQNPHHLPSFNLVALHPDHYTTILPNLSYPSRPMTHVPRSGSSVPLLFTKTTRPEIIIATSSPAVQVPTTANTCFDTSSVPEAFHRVNVLIWHNFSVVIEKLKWIKQKLFGLRATSPSAVVASV